MEFDELAVAGGLAEVETAGRVDLDPDAAAVAAERAAVVQPRFLAGACFGRPGGGGGEHQGEGQGREARQDAPHDGSLGVARGVIASARQWCYVAEEGRLSERTA